MINGLIKGMQLSSPLHHLWSRSLLTKKSTRKAQATTERTIQSSTFTPSLFAVFLTLFTLISYADDSGLQELITQSESENLTALELYKKSKSIRRSDRKQSLMLANEGLLKSQAASNNRLTAQIHTLLGKLARESKDIDKSLHHFLQSSLVYKASNDKRSQIMVTVEYASTLISEKRYEESDKIIEELLVTAIEFGDDLPIALIEMTKAEGYYQRKRFDDAINAYSEALKYLSDEDDEVQKRLALTYHKIAQTYARIKEREKSVEFFKNSLAAYTILDNRKSMAIAYKNIAMQERYMGNYINALDYAIRGIKIQRQLTDSKALAKALSGAGIIYRYLGRYEKSLAHFHESHLLYKKGNYISEVAESSKEIGLIYTRLKKFDQARSFYQLAIDLPEKKVTPKTRASALREVAVIHLNFNDFEAAESEALKAYNIYHKINNKLKRSTTARILGKIYDAQGNSNQAIFYYRKALALAIEVNNKSEHVKALTLLGDSLIATNPKEAVLQLSKALALSIKHSIKKEELTTYRLLRQAEKSQGNIDTALRYAEKEIALSKIIYTEKGQEEITKAKAKLDSHKMEMEIDALKKRAKLDQLELAKKNNEIEIVGQAGRISELELTQNRYANIALTSLLTICLFLVIYVYRRFVDSRKQNKELDYLATRDPLTNCYNRRVLFDLMNRDFSDIDLLGEYCIIMVDIDKFKEVNDTNGHSAGDFVLRGVAKILQSGVRQNDIAARYGGEEFCLVLPGAAQDQAIRIAESLRKKVEAQQFNDISVTCSFGVTSIQFKAGTPTELIDQADLALYQSKHNGRNQVTLWEKSFK